MKNIEWVILVTIIIMSIASLIWIVEDNKILNGTNSFPFDDSWIHLQFAKNISTYGSYSYFKNEMVTSGSTAPIYTLLLGLLWNSFEDKYLLEYVMGIICYCIAGWFLYRIASIIFQKQKILSFGWLILFMFEPHLQYITLSGMETILFIALLLIVWYLYLKKRPVSLGIMGGILLWCRPEGVVFLVILFFDYIYHSLFVSNNQETRGNTPEKSIAWLIKPALIILIFTGGYFAFNLLLSGTILPNSFAAKHEYFKSFDGGFLRSIGDFFYEASNPLMLLCFGIGFTGIILSLRKKIKIDLLPALLWSILLPLCYLYYLPFLFQTGRYVIPTLPFVLLIEIYGIGLISQLFGKFRIKSTQISFVSIIMLLLLASGIFSEAIAFPTFKKQFSDHCRGTAQRQVKTALWIKNSLPEDAIIATHDVGTLAYFSERKVVDMIGLVTPAMIQHVRDNDEMMTSLRNAHVNYIVTFRNWFEINGRNPLFQTNELFPEVMEVFHVDSSRFLFGQKLCTDLNDIALYLIRERRYQEALSVAYKTSFAFPESPRAHSLLSIVNGLLGNYIDEEEALRDAVVIDPGGYFTHFAIGVFAFNLKKNEEAIREFNYVIKTNPFFPLSYLYLSMIYKGQKHNIVEYNFYKAKYDSLMAAAQ